LVEPEERRDPVTHVGADDAAEPFDGDAHPRDAFTDDRADLVGAEPFTERR